MTVLVFVVSLFIKHCVFIKTFFWATLHLCKDKDHFQCVLRNVENGSTQKSFHHGAESYAISLRKRSARSDPTIGLDRKSLEIVFFARSRNSPAIAFKRTLLQRFCVRFRRKMSDASTIRRTLGEGENCLFRLVPRMSSAPQHCPGARRVRVADLPAQLLDEVQKMLNIDKTHPINLNGRIVFMSMYNDAGWDHKRHEEVCKRNVASVPACAKLFSGSTMDFPRITRQRKMVRDSLSHTSWEMEQYCRRCDEDVCRKVDTVWSGARAHHPRVVFEKAGERKILDSRITVEKSCCRQSATRHVCLRRSGLRIRIRDAMCRQSSCQFS